MVERAVRLTLLHRAMLAALALLALGLGARLWPRSDFRLPPRIVRTLPEDVCSTGTGTRPCLAAGSSASELAAFYGLPPESADRIRLGKGGVISFDGDVPGRASRR